MAEVYTNNFRRRKRAKQDLQLKNNWYEKCMKKTLKALKIFVVFVVGLFLISCKDDNRGETYYSLTIDSTEDIREYISILEDVDLTKIKKDTVITIKITVPEGQILEKFSVDGALTELTNLEYKLKVVKNHVIKIRFKNTEVVDSKYTVTLGGNLRANIADLTKFDIGDIVRISVLIPEGKLIDKFYVDGEEKTLIGTEYTLTVSKNHHVTVTFKDAPLNVTVIFDLNGGTLENLALENTFPRGGTINKPSGTPQKEGYTFVEWRLNGETYNFGVPVDSNLTLVAYYKVIVYEVTFINGDKVEKVSVRHGDIVEPLAIEDKEGLSGVWRLDGRTYDFNKPITSNLTLNAHYGAKLNVAASGSQTNEYILTFSEDVVFDADINNKLAFLEKVFLSEFDFTYVDLDAITITYGENKLKLKVTDNFISSELLRTMNFDEGDGSGILRIGISLNKASVKSKADGICTNSIIEPFTLKLWVPFADNKADYTKPISAVFLDNVDNIADKFNDPVVVYDVKFVSEDVGYEKTLKVTHRNKVIKPENPEKEGFVLTGWLKDNVLFDFGTLIKSDLILRAKWGDVASTVRVSFDTQSPHHLEPNFVTKGQTVSVPEPITLDEYEFVEWQLNGVAYNFNLPVNENITLTAKWQRKLVPITINLNGGTGITEIMVPYGIKPDNNYFLENYPHPTKSGYVFIGYAQSFNGTLMQIVEPTTLDAIWIEENKTLTFNYMYDNKVETEKVSSDLIQLLFSIINMDGSHVLASRPQREGYLFVGWYSNSDYSVPMFSENGLSLSFNYYAKWLKTDGSGLSTYKITYNSVGGTPIETVNVLIGQIYRENPNPEKEGYTFDGWYIDSEYKLPYENYYIPVYYDSDITLYAKWIKNDVENPNEFVTLTLVTNTPYGNEQVSVPKGVEIYLNLYLPENDYDKLLLEYTFLGWYDETYQNKYGYWVTFNEDKTLYALWEKSHKITGLLNDKIVFLKYYYGEINFNVNYLPYGVTDQYDLYYDEALTIKLDKSPIYNNFVSKDLVVYLKEKNTSRNVEYIIKVNDSLTFTISGAYNFDLLRDYGMFDFMSHMFFLDKKCFNGFYLDKDLTVGIDAVNYEDYIVNGKLNLYIKWKDVFFIKVDTNTVSNFYNFTINDMILVESSDSLDDILEKLNLLFLEKANHRLEGYYLDKAFTRPIAELEGMTITNDIVIYVKWEYEAPIGVTINTNGVFPLHKIKVNESIGYLYYEGYNYKGAFYDSDYTNEIDFNNHGLTNGQTIYVKLLKYYNVKIYSNDEEIYNQMGVEEGSTINIYSLPNRVKGNQMITGWKLNGKDFDINTPITGDVRVLELKPIWGPVAYYTVKFEIDGTINEEFTTLVLQNQNFFFSEKSLPYAPYKLDYSFVCWLTEAGVEFTSDTYVTSNIVLKALYVHYNDNITVSFNAGVSDVNIEAKEVRRYTNARWIIPEVFITKEGHIFDGWLYNGEKVEANTRIKETTTLVAKWLPYQTHKVTVLVGELQPIILHIPKTGAIMLNQYSIYELLQQRNIPFDTNNNEINKLTIDGEEVSGIYRVTKDVTIVAHILDISYVTVSFEVDGVIKQTYDEYYRKNRAINWLPGGEEKEGYIFVCWNLNGQEVKLDDVLQGDVTLVARYEIYEEVTISFITNVPGIVMESIVIPKYIIVGESQQPLTKENYEFLYWSIAGINEPFDFENTRIESSLTFEAVFAPATTHKVTVILGQGYDPVILHFKKGKEINVYELRNYYNLNPGGYRGFEGFFINGESVYYFVVNDDITLTATWKDYSPATVTFIVDGVEYATIEPMKNTPIYNSDVTFPNNPTKDGFYFRYWKTEDGTIFDEYYVVTEDMTVYAVWWE